MWPHAGIVSGSVGDVCEKGMNARVLLPSLFRLFIRRLAPRHRATWKKGGTNLTFYHPAISPLLVSRAFNAE